MTYKNSIVSVKKDGRVKVPAFDKLTGICDTLFRESLFDVHEFIDLKEFRGTWLSIHFYIPEEESPPNIAITADTSKIANTPE